MGKKLTKEEKRRIGLIRRALGIKNSAKELSDILKDLKKNIREFLQKDDKTIWSAVEKGMLFEAKLTDQASHKIDKEGLVQLMGLEGAFSCMSVMSREKMHALIKAGSLKKKDGTPLTKDELATITTSSIRAKQLDLDSRPVLQSVDKELDK